VIPDSLEPAPRAVEVRVPVSTIVKILLTALLVWAALQLVPHFFLFLLTLLFAVTLSPAVAWLERRGLSRSAAVGIVGASLVTGILAFIFLVIPALTEQIYALVQNLPAYRAGVEARLSREHPLLNGLVLQILDLPTSPRVAASLKQPLAWGQVAVVGVTVTILVIVLTLYLLLDGKRAYAWLLAYVPRHHRKKMATTILEVSDVVLAYMQGQLLTSFLYGAFALVVLTIFHVPAAVPLAFLAAICDIIPILGVIISTLPAVLLALTVSPAAAVSILLLYAVYHVFENYVIVPKVYGRQLSLSTLAVLVAIVLGGSLYGILGAVLVLPLVAAYPIIERIWLHEYLSDEVLKDHSALEQAAEVGSDRAVETVLRGEKHGNEPPAPAADEKS
jgi:predicted PurR-regulated permease PerM